MPENDKPYQHLPIAIFNAVVPNLYREAKLAVVLIAIPLPGTENNSEGPLYRSDGPMRYSIKGVDMESIPGKRFILQFLGCAAAWIVEDLVAQLQAEAEGMANAPVPPPEGTDVK